LTDVLVKPGCVPSGKFGTAEDNSMRGVLMLMYAWYEIMGVDTKYCFFDHVVPRTYGDDVLASVDTLFSEKFNNHTYQGVVEKSFGMGFTSAAKDDTLQKFVNIHNMSFLKRQFIYSDNLDKWLAPLDYNSVYKSLTWFLPSDSDTEESQSIKSCISALWEIFILVDNREIYEKVRMQFCVELQTAFGGSVDYYLTYMPDYSGIVGRL